MKHSFTTALLASAAAASPFIITDIYGFVPSGNRDGGNHDRYITFTVSSLNGGNKTGYCAAEWCDGCPAPLLEWTACTTKYVQPAIGETGKAGEFSFEFSQFTPEMENFTVAIRQNYNTSIAEGSVYISNATTPGYTCDISTVEANPQGFHDSGTCQLAANSSVTVPITSNAAVCTLHLEFPLLVTTRWTSDFHDTAYVVGNITELGSWYDMKPLSGSPDYTAAYPLWNGTTISLQSDAYDFGFEYKYTVWKGDTGDIVWEEGENRVFEVPAGGWSSLCGGQDTVIVGQNPDVFRT